MTYEIKTKKQFGKVDIQVEGRIKIRKLLASNTNSTSIYIVTIHDHLSDHMYERQLRITDEKNIPVSVKLREAADIFAELGHSIFENEVKGFEK